MKSEVNDSDKSEKQLLDIRDVIHNPSQINEDEWSQFVSENDYGNIFQTPEMYRVFLDTEHYEPVFTALLDENDEIMATMLGALIEEPGRIMRRFSRRIVVYGGPLISEKGDRDHLLKTILEVHNDYVKRRAIFTEIRNLAPRDELRPVLESVGYMYTDHLNILIDLSIGKEKIWQGLHKKKRKAIRKALKNELKSEVVSLSDLGNIYVIIHETYKRARVPAPPKSLIGSIISSLQKRGLAHAIGVKYQTELIAVNVALVYKDVIYDWYAAGNRRYSHLHANEYAVWVILEWALKRRFRLFDFGGAGRRSEEYGVRAFKSQFGGQQVEFGRFTCVHNRLKYRISMIGFRLWQALS